MTRVIKEQDVAARIERISSRMVANSNRSVEQEATSHGKNISFGALDGHTQTQISDKISNQVILESNPQMARAIEILTGLIVCPNGGSSVTLHYDASVSFADDKYKKDAAAVCQVLDDHFTNVIKLQNEVFDMVYDSLATAGAYVTVFIPDSNITRVFDEAGLESEIKTILDRDKVKVQGTEMGELISVSDDVRMLTVPETKRYLKALAANPVGNESEKNRKAGINAARIMRKRRMVKKNPMLKLDMGKGQDEAHSPLTKRIPTEAIKPMVFKGEADDPYAHIIITDEDGYPVEMDEEIDFDKDLRQMSDKTAQDKQIKLIANNFSQMKKNVSTMRQLHQEFNRVLEKDIFESLVDGTYAEKYKLKDDDVISTIMFHRMLKKQKTRLIFVPDHLVSYFCFDTDRYGVGRSLISKTKALSNIYTVMFYANFIGSLSNAIPHKKVNIDFDEEDIDQNQTLEMVINELIISKVGSFDFDFKGPSDVIRNLQKHGIQFDLNNVDNGDLPNMNINIEDLKKDNRPVDSSFLELVTKLLSMRIGFSPDLIDNSFKPEFSSQVVRDNDLTARQISQYVSTAGEKLTDRVLKQTSNDPNIIEKCLEVMSGGEDKHDRLEEILMNLNVSLPTADNASINEKMENIEDNIKVIRLIVETLFPDTMVDGVENVSVEHMEGVREMALAYFMQDYIRRNSSFKGIVDKVRSAEGIKEILDGEGANKEVLMEVFAEYAEKIIVKDRVLDDKLTEAERKIEEKLNADPEEDLPQTTDPVADEEDDLPNPDLPEEVEEEEGDTGGEEDNDDEVPTIDVPDL